MNFHDKRTSARIKYFYLENLSTQNQTIYSNPPPPYSLSLSLSLTLLIYSHTIIVDDSITCQLSFQRENFVLFTNPENCLQFTNKHTELLSNSKAKASRMQSMCLLQFFCLFCCISIQLISSPIRTILTRSFVHHHPKIKIVLLR
jgi:hypothetical protein